MPIYKQLNEFEGQKYETGDLFYADADHRKCTETVFVQLGWGDVAVETASSRSDITDELLFVQSDPHPIGEIVDENIGIPTHPPVRLLFDKVESVDVVIGRLKEIKRSMKKVAAKAARAHL